MVQHAMDTVTTDVQGKSALGMQRDKSLPAGFYWLECLFVLSSKAPSSLQLHRFLPPTPIRVCLDAKGQQSDKHFHQLEVVNPKVSTQLLSALAGPISTTIEQANIVAEQQGQEIKQQCLVQMHELLEEEFNRLSALAKVNPSVRQEEIEFIKQQIQALDDCINQAQVHLEAVRLVVNNH
jgi:ATP-dependent helicase HepA